MTPKQKPASDRDRDQGSLLVLAVLALIVGAVTGLVGALFLLVLERADRFRDAVIVWAHSKAFAGFLVVSIACAAGTGLAAWLVRRYSPQASGSGIPHVEAVPHRYLVGKEFRRGWPDRRVLLAAGAGQAWPLRSTRTSPGPFSSWRNWLVRRFELRVAIAALGAPATAISVSRVLLSDAARRNEAALFVLGAVAGLMAIVYNRLLLGTIDTIGRTRHNSERRPSTDSTPRPGPLSECRSMRAGKTTSRH